jgi:hypothetical protein
VIAAIRVLRFSNEGGMQMRTVLTHVGVGLGAVILLIGCNHTPIIRDSNPTPPPGDKLPDAAALVNYLNKNAQLVQNVRAKIDMDCKAGSQSIALGGNMACQKPRDFRLKGNVLGQPAVDIGSNSNEFWYWMSKAEPPHVYYCSYRDLSTGKVRVPFPFEPDMVLTALGIADYDAKATYQVRGSAKTVELIQDAVSPTGQPVKKIVVFNRLVSRAGEPQVIAHVLRDTKGTLICQAHIHRIDVDRATGAVLPSKVTIEWPSEKVTMKMDLSSIGVNVLNKAQTAVLFDRGDLKYSSFDIARGVVTTPSGFQRAGAVMPPTR